MNEKILDRVSWGISIGVHLAVLFLAFPAIKMQLDPHIRFAVPVTIDVNTRFASPPKAIPKETITQHKKPSPPPPKPKPKPKPKQKEVPKKPPVAKGTIPVPQKKAPEPEKKEEKPVKPTDTKTEEKPVAKQEPAAPASMPGDRDEPVTENVVAPVYPKEALNNNWAGTVTLEITIDKEGKPIDIDVIKSSGHASLDASFIRTIKTFYTFKPKQLFGKKMSSKLRLSYSFKLD